MAVNPYESYVVRRGRLIVINNVDFQSLSSRTGSSEDVRRLREVFEALGFHVDVSNDQSAAQMLQLISAGAMFRFL